MNLAHIYEENCHPHRNIGQKTAAFIFFKWEDPGREGVALEALAQGEPGLHVDVLARKPAAVDLAR